MKMKVIIFSLLSALFIMLTGCAEKTVSTDKSMQAQEVVQLSPAEQKERAYEVFKQILELSGGEERQKNLPQIKILYREIIEKYPDIGLAQESYLRLIMIARDENTSSGDAEAENLYQEFLGRYPDSNLRKILENEARSKDR